MAQRRDKLVQMQAPSLTLIALPSNDSIATAALQAERTPQPKLLTAPQSGKGAFSDKPQARKIKSERSQALSGCPAKNGIIHAFCQNNNTVTP